MQKFNQGYLTGSYICKKTSSQIFDGVLYTRIKLFLQRLENIFPCFIHYLSYSSFSLEEDGFCETEILFMYSQGTAFRIPMIIDIEYNNGQWVDRSFDIYNWKMSILPINSQAYLEPCQASEVEHFCKNSYWLLVVTSLYKKFLKISFINTWEGLKYISVFWILIHAR